MDQVINTAQEERKELEGRGRPEGKKQPTGSVAATPLPPADPSKEDPRNVSPQPTQPPGSPPPPEKPAEEQVPPFPKFNYAPTPEQLSGMIMKLVNVFELN